MSKRNMIGILFLIILVGIALIFGSDQELSESLNDDAVVQLNKEENLGGPEMNPHPLSIESLRKGEYPGSDIVIEQELDPGSNYQRYIASHKSDGLKIYGLLTVPNTSPPKEGYPAIIFNHGYIDPDVYRTTEKYVAYQDAFAKNGYVTFKSDYRGHGNSEGEAQGGYGSNSYTIDILNALSSVQKMEEVNPEKIGMWGHSMGGHIVLESMVVSKEVKAGVIWAGVVGSYEDLLENWRPWWIRQGRPEPTRDPERRKHWRNRLVEQHGQPSENPEFWNSISATSYLSDISGPVQLHHGAADSSVDVELSIRLNERLQEAGKEVELYTYQGDDHNISSNLNTALQRSVEFFDRYLK